MTDSPPPAPTADGTKRYCLAQDNDGHWYVIPAGHRDDWSLWLGISSDDERDAPEFAQAVGGSPSSVEFFGYELP